MSIYPETAFSMNSKMTIYGVFQVSINKLR
jgi:hypothetical protein